ncbi:MAG: carbohydrate ABC transporter permease [Treponema sp.]|jgi:putative aldouronate transport system permease protein|nr:carbohydrate ABC transporter permease [Treponema sp.]
MEKAGQPAKRRQNAGGNGNLTQISWKWNSIFLVILFFGTLIIILPLLLVVIVSFTSQLSIANKGYTFFPDEWTLEAYVYLVKTGDALFDSYAITIFYTVAGTLMSLSVMTLYAYVIAQRFFVFRKFLTWLLFFTMLFGGGLVPSYILNVRYLRINDSVWIFLLPSLMSGFNVIILRTFIKTTIPEAFIESARIDGAGHFMIFFKIVLPLFKAGIATVGLFNVVSRWNDWFTGMLYIDKPKLVPLQTVLIKLQNTIDFIKQNAAVAGTPDGIALLRTLPSENMRMACTLIVILPILFAYPFFQRYFVSGLTVGGIKE